MKKQKVLITIFRYDPQSHDEWRFQDYELPYGEGMTVLGALRYIYEHMDRTLAFRNYHCSAQVCGGCRVKVDGKTVRACNTPINRGDKITLEPLDRNKVVRDLVIEVD